MSMKIANQIRNILSEEMYAFYLRKSRADLEMEALGEGETLAKHLKILQALADKHDIHPDQIVIYREVVSGDSIHERPEMMKLLEHVHQKRYRAVFVVEIERLARGNTRDQGEVAESFQASHTKIITPMKTYDPDDESDETYFEFGLFMSRQEYKTIRRRLKKGKDISVQDGNYLLPQRVFGYDIIRPSKRDRTLTIREDEAKIVQMIFDWYTKENRATSWIARELTMMGVKTMKNKPQWHRSTINGMLSNPIYIGKLTWDGSKTVKEYDENLGRLKKVRKFDLEPEVYEGKHKGIISPEQFELAQEITESKNKPHLNLETELVNPLAGMLVCCDCGRHMISRYYRDGRGKLIMHASQTLCKKKQIPLEKVMNTFVGLLEESVSHYETKIDAPDTDEADRYREKLKALEAELEKKEKQRKRLFQDYEDEVYSREEFIERKQVYNKAIEELKAKLECEKANAPQPVDYEERIATAGSMIDCMRDPEISVQEKNEFLKQFIDFISYDVIDHGRKKGGDPILKINFK